MMTGKENPPNMRTPSANHGISEYVLRIKDWTIRKMIADYLDACGLFNEAYIKAGRSVDVPYRVLSRVCDMLFTIKEDHHLIFKRVVGPEKILREDRHKIDPVQPEVDFIAVVGMLFHKVLVARELKYIHMHYNKLQKGIADVHDELAQALAEIFAMMGEGVSVLIEFIRAHVGNVALLALLVERAREAKRAIGMSGLDVLRAVTSQDDLEAIYFLIGKYYFDSGWMESAEKLFKKILHKNPKHIRARELLEKIKIHNAQHA